MSPGLLLEIGTEEIPARFVPPALDALKNLVSKRFLDAAVTFGAMKTYGTPRRLALIVSDMATKQQDRTREVIGPPRSVAYDGEGRPTKAAEGFARSQGVSLEQLEVRKTDKGEYLAAVIEEKGRPVSELLPELLPDLISSLPFPKSMRWGADSFRFVRPVHWFVALFDGAPVSFTVAGIESGRMTRGHRFLSPDNFDLTGPDTYLADLRKRFVMADPAERAELISREARRLAEAEGGRLVEDDELLDTVSHLVEFPVCLLGRFEERYLELPRELLVTVKKGHQKYFSVENDGGKLLPCFIVVSNSAADNAETVVRGNERVLRARLEDARFYFEDDSKRRLASRVEDLKGITFQEKLGSVHDKVQRVRRLAGRLAEQILPEKRNHVERAAELAKADLTTGVVYEFPELQGYMGMVYAERDGEPAEVAQAVREHYMPRFSGDEVPETDTGSVAALADKMDSIVAFFSVGLTPTGSEDPYALRRQALGILAILERKGYSIELERLIETAREVLAESREVDDGVADRVAAFFGQRFQRLLEGEGIAYDEVEAVLAGGVGRVSALRERLAALSSLRRSEGFVELVTAAKRVINILARAPETEVSESLFTDDAEKLLFDAVRRLEAAGPPVEADKLHDLVGPINGFFDAVLVMDKDEAVQRNRLGLLRRVHGIFSDVADFSRIVE